MAMRFLQGHTASKVAVNTLPCLSRLGPLCRYKQRGKAAVEADNVFHHLTYGGSGETAPMSRHERAALEVQINEFGQCPRQIFHSPHAPRLVCPPAPNIGQEGAPLSAAPPPVKF